MFSAMTSVIVDLAPGIVCITLRDRKKYGCKLVPE